MFRVGTRVGRSSWVAMPLWVYILFVSFVLVPFYLMWWMLVAMWYFYLYVAKGITWAVRAIRTRRAERAAAA